MESRRAQAAYFGGAKLDVPFRLLHDKLSLHLSMSHATKLAAVEFQFSRLVRIELERRWRSGLELDATILHRLELKSMLLVCSRQMQPQ